MQTHSLAVQYPLVNATKFTRPTMRAFGDWSDLASGLGDLFSNVLSSQVVQSGINAAVPQLINNAIGGPAPTNKNVAGAPVGYTNIGNGMYVNAAGQVINTNTTAGQLQTQSVNSGMPSWAIPAAMVAGAGLILYLVLKK